MHGPFGKLSGLSCRTCRHPSDTCHQVPTITDR